MTTWLWVEGGSTADSTVVWVMGAMGAESVWIGRRKADPRAMAEAKTSEVGNRRGGVVRVEWMSRECESGSRSSVRAGRKCMNRVEPTPGEERLEDYKSTACCGSRCRSRTCGTVSNRERRFEGRVHSSRTSACAAAVGRERGVNPKRLRACALDGSNKLKTDATCSSTRVLGWR